MPANSTATPANVPNKAKSDIKDNEAPIETTAPAAEVPAEVDYKAMIEAIRSIFTELGGGNKFSQSLQMALKPRIAELTDFFVFVDKGWGKPTDEMIVVISDLRDAAVKLGEAALILATAADPNNRG